LRLQRLRLLFVRPFSLPEELHAFYAPEGRWSTMCGDDRVPKKRGAGWALLTRSNTGSSWVLRTGSESAATTIRTARRGETFAEQ
jgi:hypothetical protein